MKLTSIGKLIILLFLLSLTGCSQRVLIHCHPDGRVEDPDNANRNLISLEGKLVLENGKRYSVRGLEVNEETVRGFDKKRSEWIEASPSEVKAIVIPKGNHYRALGLSLGLAAGLAVDLSVASREQGTKGGYIPGMGACGGGLLGFLVGGRMGDHIHYVFDIPGKK